MKTLVGKTTFRALGHATNHNPETVRRYMSGQAPSVEFLSALVGAYSVNADWLLTGRGPMDRSALRGEALANADPNELMTAIACRMESMCDRIDRIELFSQTMETRLRVSDVKNGIDQGGAVQISEIKIDSAPPTMPDQEGTPSHDRAITTQATDDSAAARAEAIADALPHRPHPDAR